MKKFGKYLSILVLLLLGLMVMGVLYLFFVPNSSLFSITYVSKNETITSEKYNKDSITSISVNSNAFNVEVVGTEESNVYAKVVNNTFGFTTKKKKETTISSSLESGSLSISIKETTGFVLKNDSKITIYIPSSISPSLALNNVNAQTQVGGHSLSLKDFSLTTKSGSCSIQNTAINGNINSTLNKGHLTIGDNVSLSSSSDVTLSVTSGIFSANNSSFDTFHITQNTRGKISFDSCVQLSQDTTSSGGSITVSSLDNISFTSTNTNLNINTIKSSADINLKNDGNITIGTIEGTGIIKSNAGNITITKNLAGILVETNSGNINISRAVENIVAVSNSGNVNITFSQDAPKISTENPKVRTLDATLTNGSLNVYGVENITFKIKENTNGKANATIYMNDVVGTNSISSNSGSVFVQVDKNAKFRLKTSSERGSVRAHFGQFPEYNGYTTSEEKISYINFTGASQFIASGCTNELNISTISGSLYVKDTINY